MPGAPNGCRIGFPALPGKRATILLPYGHEVISINITTGDRVFIGNGYHIEPVSRPFPL
jgi:hypothetical protein